MRIDFSKFGDIRDQLFTVVVLLIALLLMAVRQDDAFQNVRKASLYVVSTLEAPLSNVRVYRTALKTNQELERQNILLQVEISRLRTLQEENESLRALLNLMEKSEFGLVPVRVVVKNLSGINNSMLVNAGTNQGVQPGMPVINAEGLIGQVVLSSSNQSQVLPLFNRQFRVSAMLEDSRSNGIVGWEATGLNELVMRYVPQTVQVKLGTKVHTSGMSNQFPFGIPIGEVTRTEPEPGKETQIIFLKPAANLYNLAEAHIMLFIPDEEVEELEQVLNRNLR